MRRSTGVALDTNSQSPSPYAMNGGDGGRVEDRPGLAILANVMTPYRANLHQLVAAGIPELELHSLVTHGVGDFDWKTAVPPEIHMSNFSIRGEHSLDHPLRRPLAELRKANRIIRYIKTHNVRAVVFTFYRYISYLRVIDYCS